MKKTTEWQKRVYQRKILNAELSFYLLLSRC